jgi:hypothetical protein
MEKVNNLQTLATVQKELLQGGMTNMVTQENLFATASSLVEALGFEEPTRFITDPADNPMQPPEPDAAEKAIEIQQQIETMKLELERQKVELDRFKAMGDLKVKELDHEVAVAKVQLEGARLSFDEPWSLEVEEDGDGDDVASVLEDIDEAIDSMLSGRGAGEVPLQ